MIRSVTEINDDIKKSNELHIVIIQLRKITQNY